MRCRFLCQDILDVVSLAYAGEALGKSYCLNGGHIVTAGSGRRRRDNLLRPLIRERNWIGKAPLLSWTLTACSINQSNAVDSQTLPRC